MRGRDIVLIPTFDRAEYLWLCLQKLSLASGIESKEVWVCEDCHTGAPVNAELQKQFLDVSYSGDARFPDRFRWIRREPHSSYGNSYNVLEAFREAYAAKAEHVYLVEDDVLVMPDFFQWHEAAHRQWAPFVSCAGRINNSLNFERNGREAIDESCKDPLACVASPKAYGSWAACFSRENLHDWILPYAQEAFYSRIEPGWEQDIIIQRQMQHKHQSGLRHFSVWPYVPRAYHMGMQSYHRTCGLSFNGTLQEKVEQLRRTVTDLQKIRSIGLAQDDIDPYPMQAIKSWTGPLYLKADYSK